MDLSESVPKETRYSRPRLPDQYLKVLVVEDDEADAYLISSALWCLPRVGNVVRARDGVEALELIEDGEAAPDLAIIDLNMPRMDGFRLLVEIACRDECYFPMVVLTSSPARTDAIRSKLRGADLVLTKPDSVSELETMLESAVATI